MIGWKWGIRRSAANIFPVSGLGQSDGWCCWKNEGSVCACDCTCILVGPCIYWGVYTHICMSPRLCWCTCLCICEHLEAWRACHKSESPYVCGDEEDGVEMKIFPYVHKHRHLESQHLGVCGSKEWLPGREDQQFLLAYHQSAPCIVSCFKKPHSMELA